MVAGRAVSQQVASGGSIAPLAKLSRRAVLAGAGGVLAAGLAGCSGGPTHQYNYRLTLEVEADGQVFTGTSVVTRAFATTPKLSLQPGAVRAGTRGEATLVDLGDGRVLLALLTGINDKVRGSNPGRLWLDGPEPVIAQRLGLSLGWSDGKSPGLAAISARRESWELESDELPILLTFRDAQDPKSFVLVDPLDIAGTMGTGVRLTRATLEITDDWVTWGIAWTLPWVDGINTLNGLRYCLAGDPCLGKLELKRP